jgi:glycosyltransferase involved in cell wall biosynthesis
MKIAQVSPLFEAVPPAAYGGTERVVSYLTEELVRQGHEVSLFATADSVTTACLIPVVERSLRTAVAGPGVSSWLTCHMIELGMVADLADAFDVIHFHTDYLHFSMARQMATPHVTTLHGRLDLPELAPLYRYFHQIPLVSISDSQRLPVPWANWWATVYHGLPTDLYAFEAEADDYLLFVGRISPEKRADRAIDIAIRIGMPLYIAAKVDPADETYFTTHIESLLDHPLVNFIGEIGEGEKHQLLSRAKALLFPIDWPEPFGLVMIEAMACGTPVIAYGHGSVPEVVQHGVSGYIVSNQAEAVEAARHVGRLDRRKCRAAYEERFTSSRMAEAYLRIYEQLRTSRRAG